MTTASWLGAEPSDLASRARCRWLLLMMLVSFGLCAWFLLRPDDIGASWRECDTQAMARNLAFEDFDLLRPRVDWRGDTDGAVESEFPLYQALVAAVLVAVGENVEWPGRLLSLISLLLAAFALHRILEWRTAPMPALLGAGAFLSGGHAAMLATRVMPDAVSTALAMLAMLSFLHYLARGASLPWFLATAATAAAALAKPTALQIGLLQFLWVCVLARPRLADPRLWSGFVAVLAIFGAWILHGRSLYEETGLTFGVSGGGDTKFPGLEHLVRPGLYLGLFRTTLAFGFSIFGCAGLLVLLVRRQLDRADLALLMVIALGLVGTIRYSFTADMGPHYHVFAAMAGAWCFARALQERPSRPVLALLVVLLGAHGTYHFSVERGYRQEFATSPVMDVAARLRSLTEPSDLVVVQGGKTRFDDFWKRRNNYEEPALLYQAGRHGFVLPLDGITLSGLKDLWHRGGRHLVVQFPKALPDEVSDWLAVHGQILSQDPVASIYHLRSPP